MQAGLLGLAALLGAVYLFSAYRGEARLRDANELGLQGRYARAAAVAATIRSAPAAGRAAAVVAYADRAAHDLRGADAAFAQAVLRSPSDWTLRRDWASTLLGLGRRARARAQMRAALALNPLLPPTPAPGFCRAGSDPRRGVVLC
ncbi:MAG: hypothetical protein QOE44_774 [Solirubrobacteraceae bacterium]|nr:hypothetical protein [Solirubrobacteraceae bacterium]